MAELKLNDVRRYAISTRNVVRYRDANGREAMLNQKGIVEIPGISGPPPYSAEDVFAQAVEFCLEPWSSSYGQSTIKVPTVLTPEQMAAEVEKTIPASARLAKEEE